MTNQATIGVYDGECCGSFHVEVALTCMGLPYATFGDDDLLNPRFGGQHSVLVFGAGHISGSPTAFGGTLGRQRIRGLVHEGRTFIGICAGAYLAVLDEPRGLGLLTQDLDHPQTGDIFQGFLTVEYPRGSGEQFPLWYQNGPVFPRDAGGTKAVFMAEQEGEMRSASAKFTPSDFAGRPAVVERHYDNGRCVLLSAHPELGSIGIREYAQLIAFWRQRETPEEYRACPNLVPVGRSRTRFLNALGELGLSDELGKPQWAMLRELIAAP
jgi:hypothetical protein